jgi:Nif-specific regulatory protein
MSKSTQIIAHSSKTAQNQSLQALELQALYEISMLIGKAVDLEVTLYEILKTLHDTLQMERATLVLFDKTSEKLKIKASYGLTKEEEARGVYELGEGITGQVFKNVCPFVVPDIRNEPMFLNRTRSRDHILTKEKLSFIGVPVVLNNAPIGVLSVDRLFGPEVSFEEDIRFLTVVATLIAQFFRLNQAIHLKEELLIEENRSLKAEIQARYGTHNIIGVSKAIRDVLLSVERVAQSRATVLISGESGTGKELVARAVHNASPRKAGPFIKVNCAALPAELLESELFGHERGAFTGAVGLKKGRFDLADGGTIFLDEIGELPLSLQPKLLRVLQEYEFERVGGTNTIHVDVRVIAATNRTLEDAIQQGMFRADLYYRLNVVPILLPPLRNRHEDILPLTDFFLKKYCQMHSRSITLSPAVLQAFMAYSWPGNVRELQNFVERLVIMSESDVVELHALPPFLQNACKCGYEIAQEVSGAGQGRSMPESIQMLERRKILDALHRNRWVQSRAAKELGLTLRQIGYKIKKYDIKPEDVGR